MNDLEKLQSSLSALCSRIAHLETLWTSAPKPSPDAEAVRAVAARMAQPGTDELGDRPRDRLICALKAEGWSKARIARALVISEQCVYRTLKRSRRHKK